MTLRKQELEEVMPRQTMLPISPLAELWETFPERARRKLVTLWAELIARAVTPRGGASGKETSDEPSDR
jgi:hypothetical protein